MFVLNGLFTVILCFLTIVFKALIVQVLVFLPSIFFYCLNSFHNVLLNQYYITCVSGWLSEVWRRGWGGDGVFLGTYHSWMINMQILHLKLWNEYVTITVNCNLSNCKNSQKKKFFGASTGFEPVASVLALQCSPSWAMKTHTLEAGQFIEFINPWKEWNTEWNDVNCGNANEMSMWPSQWIAI